MANPHATVIGGETGEPVQPAHHEQGDRGHHGHVKKPWYRTLEGWFWGVMYLFLFILVFIAAVILYDKSTEKSVVVPTLATPTISVAQMQELKTLLQTEIQTAVATAVAKEMEVKAGSVPTVDTIGPKLDTLLARTPEIPLTAQAVWDQAVKGFGYKSSAGDELTIYLEPSTDGSVSWSAEKPTKE
jgi:hypothetical protein